MCKLTDIEIGILIRKKEALQDEVCKLKEENERLQKVNERFADIGKMYSEIRAEAVKEFAKFLIDKIDGGVISYTADIPDCVVEFLEMTEKE